MVRVPILYSLFALQWLVYFYFLNWLKMFCTLVFVRTKIKKAFELFYSSTDAKSEKHFITYWSCLAAIREAIRNLEVLQQTILCNLTTACIWRTLTAFTLSSHKQCYKVLRRATKRGKMFNYWRFLISPSSGKNKRRKISVIASVTFLPGSLTKSCKIASGSHERQSFPQTFTAPA